MRSKICRCFFIVILSTSLWAGETEVEVLQGKVRGQTAQTGMVISAGQKGVIKEGQEPIIAVNDPLVQKAVELYRWVEEERQAGHAVDDASILVAAIDDEQVMRVASLQEKINTGSEAKVAIQLGPMSTFKDLKFYDFEGNLLGCEVKPISEFMATYFIHLPEPIEPGQKIRYITVSPSIKHVVWINKGPIWSTFFDDGCDSKPKLFLYHIILPQSAILLKTHPDVLLTDQIEDRIALTFRRFIDDPTRKIRFTLSFLWPDKDGSSLDDVPPEMRGLIDPQQGCLIRESNRHMARIIEGQRFADCSTPMNAFLSGVSDLMHDLDKIAELQFANPIVKKSFNGDLEKVKQFLAAYRNELFKVDLHSCGEAPAEPTPGQTAWIKFALKGSFKPIATAIYIYQEDGQWAFHGGDFLPAKTPSDEETASVPDYQALYAPTQPELARGFVVVQGRAPQSQLRLDKLEVDLGRQERDLVPITVAALSELDTVSLEVTGTGAKLCQVLLEQDYQLHPGMQTPLDINHPTRFWLDIDSGTQNPGPYELAVKLSSSRGTELTIPGTVTIHDVVLPQKRTIRMKPFSWFDQLSGLDIQKPEARRRLEVFLDDMALLRNTVCDWGVMYNPNNVLPYVKIRGADQTLQAAGRAGVISINDLPDLDFSFFDPWIGGSAKRGMTVLEMNVHLTITEHDRAFVKAVLGQGADDSDDTCWKLLMWLYGQFRNYALSCGMTETWAWIARPHESDAIPISVQTARRYQEIGYRTYFANIDDVARDPKRLNQLNAQSDGWYLSYWQMHAFLDLTYQVWEPEKRQETIGTKWAAYENGGAESTWWTPKPYFSEAIVDRVRDVVVSVNSKPLQYKQGIGWANKEHGVYMYWDGSLYVCLPDGGNPNEINLHVSYTLRQPTQGKPAVRLDDGDQIWYATNGNYAKPYAEARATAWRVCVDGTHGYSWWCYWLNESPNCIVWYDQETEQMIHSPTWHGLRDGNEDAAYYRVLQERLKARGDREGLARLAALTGPSPTAPIRLGEPKDPFGLVYHDIAPTNGYRQFNQAKRVVLQMLCE